MQLETKTQTQTDHLTNFIQKTNEVQQAKRISILQKSVLQNVKDKRNSLLKDKQKYSTNSLLIFSLTNPIRRICQRLIEWVWFDRFIILVIVANTIMLTMQDYSFRLQGKSSRDDPFLDILDQIFSSIFIFEFVVKVMAMGFVFEQNTYLRDGWNIIDFAVVITSLMSYFSKINLSAIRTIRILRPLRSINAIQGMRTLVQSIIQALPDLANVMVLLMFIILLFGILGLQIFMGITENRCRLTPKPVNGRWIADYDNHRLCGGDYECPKGLYCGNPINYGLPQQESIEDIHELNYGYTKFDNMLESIITIQQALTTEGWTKLVFMFKDGISPELVYFYFILLIFMGSFFVVNLILAVINDSFLKCQNEQNKNDENISKTKIVPVETKKSSIASSNSQLQMNGSKTTKVTQSKNLKLTIEEEQQNIISQVQSQQLTPTRSPEKLRKKQEKEGMLILIIESQAFMILTGCIIMLNTIILALDRYPMSKQEQEILDYGNLVFTILFLLEMIIKMVGYGIVDYFRDSLNLFDSVIVLVSVVEWILITTDQLGNDSSLAAISAFRALRLFRMFKLARQWVKLRQLIQAIIATISGIGYFVILLLLFMIIASLLGMELFAYRLREQEGRQTFDDFWQSMITIFVLLTNEEWNEIAYEYMKYSMYSLLYFVIVVIIGNFMLLKLFIAILLYNFSQQHENHSNNQNNDQTTTLINTQSQQFERSNSMGSQSQYNYRKSSLLRRRSSRNDIAEQQIINLDGSSLFIFSQSNKIRQFIYRIVNNQYFDFFIIFLIIITSVLLVIDDPLKQKSEQEQLIFDNIDFVITILFIIEAILKIIAYGFVINGKQSYLRQLSNVLDLIVIIFSMLSYLTQASDLSKIKILRLLRILKPLRLIARNDALKISINALIASIQQMVNLTLVCMIFFLLFGILGVNSFKGAFYHCESIDTTLYPIYHKNDCFDYGGSWVNSDYNFDNIIQAIISLFLLSTTEGWLKLMDQGIDSVGIDKQPQYNYSPYWAIFYIGFIIVGSFFVLNLFAGVIVDAFSESKDKLTGYYYLDEQQKNWVSIQIRIYQSKPIPKLNLNKNYRRKLHNILSSTNFEYLIFLFILLNTILLMVQYNRASTAILNLIYFANLFFLIIFIIEAILKLVTYHLYYFTSPWNLFDFFVVSLTTIVVILETFGVLSGFGAATSVLRSFRIVRVLRLIKKAKSLRMMFQTFIVTLPDLAGIGGLLALILFIFSVLTMNLYPYQKRSLNGVTDDSNFSSFLSSFFALFKCSTGENWNFVQADIARSIQPNNVCFDISNVQEYFLYGMNGCGNWYGYLVLITFMVLFSLIMLNLLVAVIIQGFEKTLKDESSLVKDVEQFQMIWSEFDKKATHFIPPQKISQLLLLVDPPIGWHGKMMPISKQRIELIKLEIPLYEKGYFYYDVLKYMIEEFLLREQHIEEPKLQGLVQRKLMSLQKKSYQIAENLTEFTSADFIAADLIRMRWQDIQREKRRKEEEEEEEKERQRQEENDEVINLSRKLE